MGWGNESPIAALKRAHASDARYRAELESKLAEALAVLAEVTAERDVLAARLREVRVSGCCPPQSGCALCWSPYVACPVHPPG